MPFTHKILRLAFVFVLAAFAAFPAAAQKPIKDLEPTVILIALDGFRYDYPEKFKPETLNKIAKEGVRAKWLIPAFPTKTFPNHYTIATGLYPENHGIVENNIWDFGTTFSLGKREEVQNPRWWLGEPIWVTAEKQNKRAAAFFFPGTEAPIMGIRPTFWKEYEHETPHETRVDTLLGWLDLPAAERPAFFTLYFSDADDAGHRFGPDSEQTRAAVAKIDNSLKRLTDGLRARGIEDKVNLILVSDHGMAAVDQRNAVILDDFMDYAKTERMLWTGEIVQIFPKQGEEDKIMAGLSKIEHAKCWRKADVPARLHYSKGARIAPVICSADEGWFLTSRDRYEVQKKRANFTQPEGRHGYDNSAESMRALFIARGPAFKKGKTVDEFENIHIYELMTKILGLKPAKNDGSLERVKHLLK